MQISDQIFALTRKPIEDEILVTDLLRAKAKITLFESILISELISKKIPKFTQSDIGISDQIFALTRKPIEDEILIDDAISKLTRASLFDEILIDGFISKKIPKRTFSDVAIDDQIFALTMKVIEDNVVIDDNISKSIRVSSLFDGISIDDVIIKTIRKEVFDELTTDDFITKQAQMRMFEEILINTDTIIAVHIQSAEDSIGIDDFISKTLLKTISDGLTTDDFITKQAQMRMFEEVLIDDSISKDISLELLDQVLVDDAIFTKPGKKLFDGVSTDDSISFQARMFLWDHIRKTEETVVAIKVASMDDSVGIDDYIQAKLVKFLYDTVVTTDSISLLARMRTFDELLTDDFITKQAQMSIFDETLIDDAIDTNIGKKLFDVIATDDLLSFQARMTTFDEVTTDDAITKQAQMRVFDDVAVTDLASAKLGKVLFDGVSTDDSISFVARMFLLDEVVKSEETILLLHINSAEDGATIDDQIFAKLKKRLFEVIATDDFIAFQARMRIFDQVGIDDVVGKKVSVSLFDEVLIDTAVSKTTLKDISDSVGVDDTISFQVRIRLEDGTRLEAITVTDAISSKPLLVMSDSSLVDDSISVRIFYGRNLYDEVAIDDTISKKISLLITDEVITSDALASKARMVMTDSVSIDDSISTSVMYARSMEDIIDMGTKESISVIYRFFIFETVASADSVEIKGSLNIETRDLDNVLTPSAPAATYRVIPNPLTGTGSLLVTDGGVGDYDGVNNGQISVFPVPLGTYRINQTAITPGLSSLINFTYSTVHLDVLNSTALFRVVVDPADLDELETTSDRIDIADGGFDDLLNAVELVNYFNGTQVIINKTSELPYPLFAGVNNASAIGNATALQSTLFYRNLVGLGSNETPYDIIAAFRQTPYDSGNFTETSFVGVLSATPDSTYGQYLATEPFDKFNCGQQYIYGLHESLVPTYGGITDFNFTLSATGTCPETPDYLTHEIAAVPPVGSGSPPLPDEDVLLYINPQNPGAGVNFRNAANTDSIQYTIITSLPVTGDVNDVTVYLENGFWTTDGVTEISKQLITSGPNAGKAEIQVSLDYLSKILVSGKRFIIPIGPPITNVDPGVGPKYPAGVSGGQDEGVAKVHRIEYDVCDENISRILVGHASDQPPILQILATESGVFDAKLAAHQPFLEENKVTLIDKYLFEAPLSPNENLFTIFAVDYRSQVDRVMVEIEGCEGVIVIVDDQVVLPTIFDVKYQMDNSTFKPEIEHSYVEEGQEIEVSAIVQSPIVPLIKAELYVSTIGQLEETVIPMDISALELQGITDLSVVSATIPGKLMEGPAVEYWIRVVTEEGIVQESDHSIVGVKPDGYSGESIAEMDTVTIKAQGTTLKPTAYLTNEAEISVFGTVSLVVDGETVYSQPTLLTPGQNRIGLEWKVPKSDISQTYEVQTMLQVYDKEYVTSEATLNTFVRTKIVPLEQQSEITPVVDENGNTIARPAMMYSSNEGDGQFRVTSPDGTCVIGSGCLVEESTLLHRGGIDSVILDGQIYRVRYSGADNVLERFSITSLDSVLGEWKVEIEKEIGMVPEAAAAEENPIKVQYRAERSPLVTVRSD